MRRIISKTLPAAALLAALALLSPAVSSPAAAGKRKLALADLTADPPIAGRPISALAWLPDGKAFSYLRKKGSEDEPSSELWIEDVESGEKRLLVDDTKLVAPPPAGTKTEEKEKSLKEEPAKPAHAEVSEYRWSPDGWAAVFSSGGRVWILDRASGRVERLTNADDDEEYPTFSPDGKRVAFVRKNDLYTVELASRRETRLTSDGTDLVMNGKCDWVYEEELADRVGKAYEWAPDGSAIAYIRLDDAPIDPYPLVDFLPVPAKVEWERYPKAGAKNPLVAFGIVGMDGKRLAWAPLAAEGAEGYIPPSFSWTADSRSACYRVLNREQNRREVRLLDRTGGEPRTLFVEEDKFWINDDRTDPPRFLKDGRFLWVSERSGFRHLYVGDVRGGALRAITHGDWLVDEVVGVEEKKGLVYFTATEEDPRRRPLYRVRLDGTGFEKLSGDKGTHAAELSADGRYLLDTYSTVTRPPSVRLCDAGGRVRRVVDERSNRLGEFELATTEEHHVTAKDGARLEARLVKPADFDPSRKYPVIVYVYGGPHAQLVHDAWGATSLFDHYMASKGYLVWTLDNRGSWGRGHAWESVIFHETGKHELADQLEGVRYLKGLPYVDPARIGIWGWSYGGYMTLYALTNAPDVFKCGVSGAPVTHWKFYDTIYTERFMWTPQENAAGYEASAPLTKAGNLAAKLLLIHGTGDDNVHMQNTIAFIDALVKAGKPYELRLGPGQKHGFRGKPAVDLRNEAVASFFERNL
jgi:dipeptidyl-peptidase 4